MKYEICVLKAKIHDEFIDIRTVMKKLLCSFVFQCDPCHYVEELVEYMKVQ